MQHNLVTCTLIKKKDEVTAQGRLRLQTDISTGHTGLMIRKAEAVVISEIQMIKVAM